MVAGVQAAGSNENPEQNDEASDGEMVGDAARSKTLVEQMVDGEVGRGLV